MLHVFIFILFVGLKCGNGLKTVLYMWLGLLLLFCIVVAFYCIIIIMLLLGGISVGEKGGVVDDNAC